jgi:hypothetical protein
VASEATPSGISNANSQTEMYAIAYTVVNRLAFIMDNNLRPGYFGGTSASIPGMIQPGQFAGIGNPNWELLSSQDNIDKIDTSTPSGKALCDYIMRAITAATDALHGLLNTDPFASQGGTYGFKTEGAPSPGPNFYALPQILGSGNAFYGL